MLLFKRKSSLFKLPSLTDAWPTQLIKWQQLVTITPRPELHGKQEFINKEVTHWLSGCRVPRRHCYPLQWDRWRKLVDWKALQTNGNSSLVCCSLWEGITVLPSCATPAWKLGLCPPTSSSLHHSSDGERVGNTNRSFLQCKVYGIISQEKLLLRSKTRCYTQQGGLQSSKSSDST